MTPAEETTRLQFLAPRPPMPEGVATIQVDLAEFFVTVRNIGKEPSLLLLTLRAIRPRQTFFSLRVEEVAWLLRAARGKIRRWLGQLSHHGLVIFDRREEWGGETLVIEIVRQPLTPDVIPIGTPPGDRVGHHELPTHWFVHVLPRIGRNSFLVYLRLLSHERERFRPAAFIPEKIARELDLRGPWHLRLHLARLRRHGLVVRHISGRGLVVRDPPPLTRGQRSLLTLRRLGVIPRDIVILSLLLALLALLIALLTSFNALMT